MRTVPLLLATALALAPAAQARKVPRELAAARSEIRAMKIEAAAVGSEVGDPDSFGRNVHFIGDMQSGDVMMLDDCTPDPSFPPGPEDRCVTVAAAPAVTTFNLPDVARVVIPGRSAHSLICHWQTPFVTYAFGNHTGVYQPDARFVVTPTYTIQNATLDDPSLIDPSTGAPFGGEFTVPLSGIRHARSLQPEENQVERENATRVCLGGIVSAQLLRGFGLSDAQVTQFFRNDTVITMNLTGEAQLVDWAAIIYGVRFVGD